MAYQFQPTCSICCNSFQGDFPEQNDLNFEFFWYHEVAGHHCKYCGADVCIKCSPKSNLLILLGFRKHSCPKCGKPQWIEHSYYIYTEKYFSKASDWLLSSNVTDISKKKDDLLVLLAKCEDQVIDFIFSEALHKNVGVYNQGDRLRKLAEIARIGWHEPFKDGKIEERILELAIKHPDSSGAGIRFYAYVTLIQFEEIFHSDKSIPVLLKVLENDRNSPIIGALAGQLPALAWRKDVIDICVDHLLHNRDYETRRLLAEKLSEAVGTDKAINDRIIDGLALALKQKYAPLKEGSLVSTEIPPCVYAAVSLGHIGPKAMHAVPALIQALKDEGFFKGSTNPYTQALRSITGMNFETSDFAWQAWWDKNHKL